jgi:hypothetical protein
MSHLEERCDIDTLLDNDHAKATIHQPLLSNDPLNDGLRLVMTVVCPRDVLV